jgi:hypothetical protein
VHHETVSLQGFTPCIRNYIQHSAHIAPGRDGLFNLIKGIPPTLKYEPRTIVAEGDFVIVHGCFSGLPHATVGICSLFQGNCFDHRADTLKNAKGKSVLGIFSAFRQLVTRVFKVTAAFLLGLPADCDVSRNAPYPMEVL